MWRIRHSVVLGLHILISSLAYGQKFTNQDSLKSIFRSDSVLAHYLSDSSYRIQFAFTELNDGVQGETFFFGQERYFYPASSIKLPIAWLCLKKLQELNTSPDSYLQIQDALFCPSATYISKLESEKPSFKELIAEMLVVSDNEAYSALYHFLTPEYIHKKLKEIGLVQTRIPKSFTGCYRFESCVNPYSILDSDYEVIFESDGDCWDIDLDSLYAEGFLDERKIGEFHESNKVIVPLPYDFNYNFVFPINEAQQFMLKLTSPLQNETNIGLGLNESDRNFLLKCLSAPPSTLKNVKYHDLKNYPKDYFKYLYSPQWTDDTAKFILQSKIGLSHGFTTELAHVLKVGTRSGFVLSVSIYTNKNQTVNDGNYEYESEARVFIRRLGEVLVKEVF